MEYLRKKNYRRENEPSGQQTSEPNPEASSDNPNPEAPLGYSEIPNPETQCRRRPDTLDLPGPSGEPHRDDVPVEIGERELEHLLNYLPKELESPVRDPAPAETDIFTSFSLLSNGRYIFSFSDSRLLLTSLDGIKFLSICWVVLAHACYVAETLPAINYISIFEQWINWPFILILNTQLAVDNFLVCTGVLISYNFFNDMNRRGIKQIASGRVPGGHNIIKGSYFPVFFFHRYIRLAPAMAMMVLLQASILHHLGSGPFWKSGNGYLLRMCQETWWGTLLFVQNFINVDKLCLPHSWYAMVDLQLYLVSPLILLLFLHVKRKKAMTIAIIVIIAGIVGSFLLNYYVDLPAAMTKGGAAKWHLKMKYDYIMVYTRLTPWMIGMIVGFLLHHYRSEERIKSYSVIKHKWSVIFAWILSLGCFGYSIFGIIPFTIGNPEDHRLLRAIYNSYSPFVWALGVGWVIFACETGHGGILHASLSQKIFQPLQRLTYCIYLVHLPLMTHRAFLTRVPTHMDITTGIATFFGDLLFSLHCAVALCLLVELPFRRIFKTLSINYGFALRFTEDGYSKRFASEYNHRLIREALSKAYDDFQTRSRAYVNIPTLFRSERTEETAGTSRTITAAVPPANPPE